VEVVQVLGSLLVVQPVALVATQEGLRVQGKDVLGEEEGVMM